VKCGLFAVLRLRCLAQRNRCVGFATAAEIRHTGRTALGAGGSAGGCTGLMTAARHVSAAQQRFRSSSAASASAVAEPRCLLLPLLLLLLSASVLSAMLPACSHAPAVGRVSLRLPAARGARLRAAPRLATRAVCRGAARGRCARRSSVCGTRLTVPPLSAGAASRLRAAPPRPAAAARRFARATATSGASLAWPMRLPCAPIRSARKPN
jgi:hypothetical protein